MSATNNDAGDPFANVELQPTKVTEVESAIGVVSFDLGEVEFSGQSFTLRASDFFAIFCDTVDHF